MSAACISGCDSEGVVSVGVVSVGVVSMVSDSGMTIGNSIL